MKSKIFLCVFLLSAPLFATDPQPLSGYDGGFYVRDAEDNFRLTINGRVQPQFTFSRTEAPSATNGKTLDTFFIRRARVQFTADLYKKVSISSLIDHNSEAPRIVTPIAWITYRAHPLFELTSGMVTLPMDRMGDISSGWYQMTDIPITGTQEDGAKGGLTITRQSFGLPTDLGLRIDGGTENFGYALGFGNGSGAWKGLNPNDAFSFGGRLDYHVLEKVPFTDYVMGGDEKPMLSLHIGSGFEDEDATETVLGTSLTRNWRASFNTGVAYRYRGFSLTAEGYYRFEGYKGGRAIEDSNGDQMLEDMGYYLQAGYFVIPKKLQVVGLASQIKREGPDNDAIEGGIGLSFYPMGNNNVKFQVDYTHVLDYDDIFGLNNDNQHRVRAMLTAQF